MLVAFVFVIFFSIIFCCDYLQIIFDMKTAYIHASQRDNMINVMRNFRFTLYAKSFFVYLINGFNICPNWHTFRPLPHYRSRRMSGIFAFIFIPSLFIFQIILTHPYFYMFLRMIFPTLQLYLLSFSNFISHSSGAICLPLAFSAITMAVTHCYMSTLARGISENRFSNPPSVLHGGVLFYLFFIPLLPLMLIAMAFSLFFKLCYNSVSHVQSFCIGVREIMARQRDSSSLIIYNHMIL